MGKKRGKFSQHFRRFPGSQKLEDSQTASCLARHFQFKLNGIPTQQLLATEFITCGMHLSNVDMPAAVTSIEAIWQHGGGRGSIRCLQGEFSTCKEAPEAVTKLLPYSLLSRNQQILIHLLET